MTTKRKRVITINPSTYQPSKEELEEEVKLDVPGRTMNEKMKNAARALFDENVEIRYEKTDK